MAVNNFGIGGSNAHLLLKSNPVKRNFTSQFFDKLFLVVISGRTAESVKFIIEFVRHILSSKTQNEIAFIG